MAETKKRFREVKDRSSTKNRKTFFLVEGFADDYESELRSVAGDSTDEFLLYSDPTPVRPDHVNRSLEVRLFRVLFVNMCSLVWSTFLAFVTK